jgi:hypothetical protein
MQFANSQHVKCIKTSNFLVKQILSEIQKYVLLFFLQIFSLIYIIVIEGGESKVISFSFRENLSFLLLSSFSFQKIVEGRQKNR